MPRDLRDLAALVRRLADQGEGTCGPECECEHLGDVPFPTSFVVEVQPDGDVTIHVTEELEF